jgi:exosortase/archaeosortase family protein
MSLVTFAIFYGLIIERRIWIRWVLVFFAIPTAVTANAARIVGAGLLAEYKGPQFAAGFYHLFSGWLIFVLAVGVLMGLRAVASRTANRRVAA